MKRRFAIVSAVLVLVLLSAIVMVLITWAGTGTVQGADTRASIPAIVGIATALSGYRRYAVVASIVMAFLAPVARVGAHRSAGLGRRSLVDRLDAGYLLWMTLFFLVGGLLPALLLPLLMRKRPKPHFVPHALREATIYTVMTTFRVLGTIAGSRLVIALVSQVNSLGIVYLIGLIVLVIAVFARLSGLARIYYVFMVPATACLNATTLTQVGELGEQRVVDNVVGGALVIAATVITIGYSNWAGRHGEATDIDHEVEAAIPAVTGPAS